MDGLGLRIKNAREQKGYNQKQFAEKLDITAARLSSYEKDKREPDFFMFSKIVKVLDADPNVLLGLESMNKSNTLTHDEQQLINDYRDLSPQGQEYIRQTMFLAKQTYKKSSDNSLLEEQSGA